METPASSQQLITPEDVLESLMNDGTVDAIRMKIITQLKANEELKNTTIKMVEQSRVLNTPGAEKQTKRELFDALRQELETSVLEKASKSVWEMMLDNNGLGKEISETVERVFCRLSGKEAPLYSQNNIEALLEKAKEVDAEGSREKELKRNTENSHSSSKKRKPDETSKEDGANGVADGSNATVPGPFDDSSRMPHPNAKT
ncbi:OLC1v1002015C2 [Oldenlandia corymbosa var. corymbosa]|uniref:OLC1v1002015C2 n=1 Tax=Oldenlandia corymbosa var. corymbosa TaxID=529605 RepID=A0AAV1D9J3_OLDCO|nr:OLC1v1002015C2 [Oldenlandia corymbosa var. corymbosa]